MVGSKFALNCDTGSALCCVLRRLGDGEHAGGIDSVTVPHDGLSARAANLRYMHTLHVQNLLYQAGRSPLGCHAGNCVE